MASYHFIIVQGQNQSSFYALHNLKGLMERNDKKSNPFSKTFSYNNSGLVPIVKVCSGHQMRTNLFINAFKQKMNYDKIIDKKAIHSFLPSSILFN